MQCLKNFSSIRMTAMDLNSKEEDEPLPEKIATENLLLFLDLNVFEKYSKQTFELYSMLMGVKKWTLLMLILSISLFSNAQDIITLKTGDLLTVKMYQITDREVKYKELNNLDGPLYTLSKSNVFSIKYQNGTKTVFDNVSNNDSYNQTANKRSEDGFKKFETDSSDFAKVKEKAFGGPRIGLTYIAAGSTASYLKGNNLNPLVTQFGWQFERRLFTTEDGTSGVVEFVPMVGGIEQGLFLPNASFLIGIRNGGKRSLEFALGPNFSVAPDYKGDKNPSAGLVAAAGLNFVKGNINFPVNIAFVPSIGSRHDAFDTNGNVVKDASGNNVQKNYETGWKISLVVGFNLRKK